MVSISEPVFLLLLFRVVWHNHHHDDNISYDVNSNANVLYNQLPPSFQIEGKPGRKKKCNFESNRARTSDPFFFIIELVSFVTQQDVMRHDGVGSHDVNPANVGWRFARSRVHIFIVLGCRAPPEESLAE